MEIILIFAGFLFLIIGLAGCILPGIPGPPLNFISILLLQWAFSPFSNDFLIMWAIITIAVSFLDYLLPVYVSKKFGATRSGIIGSIVGLIIGIIFSPIGMIAGLIIGAVVGDLLAGKNIEAAIKSGLGSALGTLLTIGFKLIASVMMSWYFVVEVFKHYTNS